jgi:hypothetical protein
MAKKTGKPRTRKTKPDAPGTDVDPGDEKEALTPSERQALFLTHRTSWNEVQAKIKLAKKLETDVVATLKADGFSKKQMMIADDLGTTKGEAKVTAEVGDRLQVARWIGHSLGAQMDLFEQPDRTPSVDIAYEEGKRASITNKPAKPDYSPETPQYRAYMAGYSEHQRELLGGLKAPSSIDQSKMAHGGGPH